MLESIDQSESIESSYSNGYQIEPGLALARGLSEARDARRKEAMLNRADPSHRPQIQANQRALGSLVASYLTKTGFEVDKFEAISQQHQAELRLFLEEQQAEAVKNSAQVTATLRRSVDGLFEAFHQLAERPREIVDRPVLIWWTDGITAESQVEPGHSLAKFAFEVTDVDNRNEELSFCFYFVWQNPSDQFAVINVDSALVLNGVLHAFSNGDSIFSPQYSVSYLELSANLYLYELPISFSDPPEPKAADKKQVVYLFSHPEGIIIGIGGIDSKHVREIPQVHVGPFLVAPHVTMMFEVTVSMEFAAFNGRVSVDFEKGDFQVMCPGVAITILS
jgi:hypothetical protein